MMNKDNVQNENECANANENTKDNDEKEYVFRGVRSGPE